MFPLWLRPSCHQQSSRAVSQGCPSSVRHGCLSLSMSLCLCWHLCWHCSAGCCLSSPSSPSLSLLCFFPSAVPSSQCLKRSLTTGNLLLFLPPNLFTKSRYKLHAEPPLHKPRPCFGGGAEAEGFGGALCRGLACAGAGTPVLLKTEALLEAPAKRN